MDEEEVKDAPMPTETPEMPPQEQAMPEQMEGGGDKEKIKSIVAEFLPDSDTESEAGFYQSVLMLLDKFKSIHDGLLEVVQDEPEFGAMLNDILKGGKASEALTRYYDLEGMAPAEGEPDYEAYSKMKGERSSRVSEMSKRREEISANREISIKEIGAFIAETGMGEEESAKFLDWADRFYADGFDGKVTKQHLSTLLKAYKYDTDVTQAEETGRIAGRNEKIVETKNTIKPTDGLPNLQAGNARPPVEKPKTLLQTLYGGKK